MFERFVGNALMFLLILAAGSGMDVHPATALTMEERNTISVYEKVAPSVVNITTQVCDPEFFLCAVPSSGSGSGIVLSEDGLILTNYHVIANADNIQVTLADGRSLKAEVAGKDRGEDLAVIRVDVGDRGLKAIELAGSDVVTVGQKVLAVGNPFGLGQTLTTGTVSMVGRDIRDEGRMMRDLIQTDAAINPGNSGGALVNSEGELVGVNTIILSPTGTSIGIGLAIPVSRVKKVVSGIESSYEKWIGWILGFVIVFWILRKIFG